MKKFRKLIPALCMLLVSALFVGTSTYAWFSMNKEVSAANMQITAKSADPYLQISADGTNFGTKLDSTKTADAGTTMAWVLADNLADTPLKLVTATKVETGVVSWGWASSTNIDDAQVSNATKSVTMADGTASTDRSLIMTGTVADETTGTPMVLKQTMTFKNASQSAAAPNLKIDSVTFADVTEGATNSIKDAVRILVVTADNKTVLYKADGTIVEGALTTATVDGGKAIIANSLAANSTTNITVYMYFDGTDAVAKTTNSASLDKGVKASFNFSID